MKKIKLLSVLLSFSLVFGGCQMSNTAKGGLIGAGSGAALGAIIGQIAGHSGKSTAIGAAIGTAVGAGAGVIIGKKMDKAAAEAAAIEQAKVEKITDANGLTAVKVTFDGGILFATNSSVLNSTSKTALTKLAKVLSEDRTMDIAVYGHTDNTGSLAVNQKLSADRAGSVATYLRNNGVATTQFKYVLGKDFQEPIASNETVEGRAQNRRVEVYMYASEQMIKDASK
jgi:Outer membrane protein and related peptidoglycan-associated (lipo)proteins